MSDIEITNINTSSLDKTECCEPFCIPSDTIVAITFKGDEKVMKESGFTYF